MERSPSRASTCLARARRERGQKRVPLPPANITGRKSIAFNIEETSYATKITFAQGKANYFQGGKPTEGLACAGCNSFRCIEQLAATNGGRSIKYESISGWSGTRPCGAYPRRCSAW